MGFVWGIFYGLPVTSVIGRVGPGWLVVGGMAVLIVMPVLGAVIGFVLGVIHAFLQNVFAGWVGGINLEFSQ